MSDQCIHCIVRGDIKECKKTSCHKHESWYAIKMINDLDNAYKELKALQKKYYDLIMCVGKKYTNETRHETVKRYILEREHRKGTII